MLWTTQTSDNSFAFRECHLRLWMSARDIQESRCLCHLLAPPDQHHLTISGAQDGAHTQWLSQQRQGVSKLCPPLLAEFRRSTWPVCSQVVFVTRQAHFKSEGRHQVPVCIFSTFFLIHRRVTVVQSVLNGKTETKLSLRSLLAVYVRVPLLLNGAHKREGGWIHAWLVFRRGTGWCGWRWRG